MPAVERRRSLPGRVVPLREIPLPAVLFALALALAGCSGDPDSDVATDPVGAGTSNAPSTGPSAGLSDLPTEVPKTGRTVAGADLAKRIDTAALSKGSVAFSIESSGSSKAIGNGKASGRGKGFQLKMTATVGGAKALELIKTNGVVYLKPPSPVGGKPWLKITDSKRDVFQPLYSEVFKGLETAGDLGATADAIAEMGTFTVAGTENVDGVQATKYVAAPPASRGVKLLPQAFQALTQEKLRKAKTVITVWVEPNGLLRRTSTVFTVTGNPAAQSRVTYSDWGTTVSITAPPTVQVTSAVRPG